jgi:hypothetical protein
MFRLTPVLPTQRPSISMPVVTFIFSSKVSFETNALAAMDAWSVGLQTGARRDLPRATALAQAPSPVTFFAGWTYRGMTVKSRPIFLKRTTYDGALPLFEAGRGCVWYAGGEITECWEGERESDEAREELHCNAWTDARAEARERR